MWLIRTILARITLIYIHCSIFRSNVCRAQDDRLDGPSNNPEDRPMLLGSTVTLTCSIRPGETVAIVVWYDTSIDSASAIYLGTTPSGTPKYTNFALDSDGANQWNLVINNVEAEDGGTYLCQDTATSENYFAEQRYVEKSATSITMTEDGTEVTTVTVTEGIPSNIVCTSLASIPIIDIIWTQEKDSLSDDITSAASQTNTTNVDLTTDSVSTLEYTFSKDYNGGTLSCRTSGQQLAESKSDSSTLNVQYVPLVTVSYGGGEVICKSDANPAATTHIIIVNGADEYSPQCEGTTRTLKLEVEYDTNVRCNATNLIGTGTDTTVAEPGAPFATTQPPTLTGITTKPVSERVNNSVNMSSVILVVLLCVSIIVIILLLYRLYWNKNSATKEDKKESSAPHSHQTHMDMDPQTRQYESTYEQLETKDAVTSDTAQAYMGLNPHTRDENTAYQDLNPNDKSQQEVGIPAYEEIKETKDTQAYVNVQHTKPGQTKRK